MGWGAGTRGLIRASFCLLFAAFFSLPVAASAAQSHRDSATLRHQIRRATEIDLYAVYPYRETRTNIRSSDIRFIACWMPLHRGDAGWRVIEAALHDARLEPGSHNVNQVDLRVGLALADSAGEFSSLYFESNLAGRRSPLRGVLDGRSILVPASVALAIYQVMGRLPRDCPTHHRGGGTVP
jgi:hypothetical protein